MISRRLKILGLIVSSVGLLSCKRESGSGGTSTKSADYSLPKNPYVAQCEPGVPGGRLVIADFGAPKTFNPVTANESSSDDIIRFLFSGLVSIDAPTQKIVPALAESWSVDADQKTWTLKLREGVRWSDGHPFSADDVIFTWNDIIYNPAIDNVTADAVRVHGTNFTVTKVDDFTVRVVTPTIYAPFLENFATRQILPKHVLSAAVANKRFESAYGINSKPEEVIGTGPFRLKQFKPGESTLLERNPHFWIVDKANQRLPYLQNVLYAQVPSYDAMALRFLGGQSDVYERMRPDEFERFKQESAGGRFQVAELGVAPERLFFSFNQNTNVNPKTGKPIVDPKKLKWFRNTKFRQAISYAIDRESIVKSIYSGRAKPSYGFETEGNIKWFNPNIRKYPYDPAKARALLAEIGIQDRNGDGFLEDADGNVIEFVFNTNSGNNVREKTAVLIQEDLKRLGIRLIFQAIDFNTLISKINDTHDFECFLMAIGASANDSPTDPSSGLNVLISSGYTHQWFPRQKQPSTDWEARIDFLMEAQLQTPDFAQRKKLYDEVQEILSEQVPMIYTVSPMNFAAYRSDLANARPTVLHYYRVTWNVEELYYRKK